MSKINYTVNLVPQTFVGGTPAPQRVVVKCKNSAGVEVAPAQSPYITPPVSGQFDDGGASDTYTVTAQAVSNTGAPVGSEISGTISDSGSVTYNVPGTLTLTLTV